jgi:hypothetical protein
MSRSSGRNLALCPEVRSIAEHVQQLLAHFLVELGSGRNLVEHHHKTGLRAGFVDRVGHAVIQRIPVLAKVCRQVELGGQQLENIGLGLGMGQIGIEEMGAQRLCCCLKIRNAIGANGLHDVRANIAQRCFRGLTKWRVHLRDSF